MQHRIASGLSQLDLPETCFLGTAALAKGITARGRRIGAKEARRAPVTDAGGNVAVFIGFVVVTETKPATPVSQGGRGVEKPREDDRDDL